MPDPNPAPELGELAEWCRAAVAPPSRRVQISPADLQRPPHRLTWNAACSALEALESRGDLERIPGPTLAWKPTPPPQRPGKGYALPLSTKEHGALLRGLERLLQPLERYPGSQLQDDVVTLRAIRSRLKRP